jgi:hypothetical protein
VLEIFVALNPVTGWALRWTISARIWFTLFRNRKPAGCGGGLVMSWAHLATWTRTLGGASFPRSMLPAGTSSGQVKCFAESFRNGQVAGSRKED